MAAPGQHRAREGVLGVTTQHPTGNVHPPFQCPDGRGQGNHTHRGFCGLGPPVQGLSRRLLLL